MWYKRSVLSMFLMPLGLIYHAISQLRRHYYTVINRKKFRVPVIVVGNITVGGVGKTPLVAETVKFLREQGLKPGIVSRGYGGQAVQYPVLVSDATPPKVVGDEPYMLWQKTGCPVVVDPNRVRAVETLLAKTDCTVVISDDGLQHYAMHRDYEIVVVDANRKFGNGYCLPAGPLREPISRLDEVDCVVWHGDDSQPMWMLSAPTTAHNLVSQQTTPLNAWQGRVHAVAGIGHPERFFKNLEAAGLDIIRHAFRDHYHFQAKDLDFNDDLPILMTEKDAVKCQAFKTERMWFSPLEATVSKAYFEKLNAFLLRESH